MNIDFTAIAPLIEQLAAKLGVAAEYLWGVLVRQAALDGIVDVVVGLIMVLVAGGAVKCLLWYYKNAERQNQLYSKYCRMNSSDKGYQEITDEYRKLEANDEVRGGITVVACVIGAVALILTVLFLYSGIKHMLNPEYYAFMDIISRLK